MVLVRPVETPETIGGGKILLTEKTREDMTSQQMEVLAIGTPRWCDNFDCELAWKNPQVYGGPHWHPHGLSVGDWVLVAHRSLSETDTDGIFIVPQDSILAILCA